ncbi:Hypothetical protein A7982_11992 [Minicystis rosea]|nr:Hypothetical protein A7982_11992 [Minicystis rosea]
MFRLVFEAVRNNKAFALGGTPEGKVLCNKAFGDSAQRGLCRA